MKQSRDCAYCRKQFDELDTPLLTEKTKIKLNQISGGVTLAIWVQICHNIINDSVMRLEWESVIGFTLAVCIGYTMLKYIIKTMLYATYCVYRIYRYRTTKTMWLVILIHTILFNYLKSGGWVGLPKWFGILTITRIIVYLTIN
jgi:hypothetical protein